MNHSYDSKLSRGCAPRSVCASWLTQAALSKLGRRTKSQIPTRHLAVSMRA
jgi:hypothetical protein